MNLVIGYILVLVVADVAFKAYHDVTPFGVQAAIELQHGPGILVKAVAHVGLQVAVNDVWG